MSITVNLPRNLNPSPRCSCGGKKAYAEQWCADCYALLPKYSAISFARKIKALNSQINSSQRLITRNRTASPA